MGGQEVAGVIWKHLWASPLPSQPGRASVRRRVKRTVSLWNFRECRTGDVELNRKI